MDATSNLRLRIDPALAAGFVLFGVSQHRMQSALSAASAGEDYELCACVPGECCKTVEAIPPTSRLNGIGLTWIGSVVEGTSGVVFLDGNEELSGYEHSFSE